MRAPRCQETSVSFSVLSLQQCPAQSRCTVGMFWKFLWNAPLSACFPTDPEAAPSRTEPRPGTEPWAVFAEGGHFRRLRGRADGGGQSLSLSRWFLWIQGVHGQEWEAQSPSRPRAHNAAFHGLSDGTGAACQPEERRPGSTVRPCSLASARTCCGRGALPALSSVSGT